MSPTGGAISKIRGGLKVMGGGDLILMTSGAAGVEVRSGAVWS